MLNNGSLEVLDVFLDIAFTSNKFYPVKLFECICKFVHLLCVYLLIQMISQWNSLTSSAHLTHAFLLNSSFIRTDHSVLWVDRSVLDQSYADRWKSIKEEERTHARAPRGTFVNRRTCAPDFFKRSTPNCVWLPWISWDFLSAFLKAGQRSSSQHCKQGWGWGGAGVVVELLWDTAVCKERGKVLSVARCWKATSGLLCFRASHSCFLLCVLFIYLFIF